MEQYAQIRLHGLDRAANKLSHNTLFLANVKQIGCQVNNLRVASEISHKMAKAVSVNINSPPGFCLPSWGTVRRFDVADFLLRA